MSRVTNLNGLYLTGTSKLSAIKTDQRATEQYNTMKERSKIELVNNFGFITESSLIVTLLNTRSYNKHKDDILSDHILMESDLMCLTETQISHNSQCDTSLSSFTLVHNINIDRFSSLIVGYRDTVEISELTEIPGATFFKLIKRTLQKNTISFLLIYRKNSFCQEESLYMIQHFLGNSAIDVILGDFNVNALGDNNYFMDYLTDYEQIVSEPTHISGSIIDHIYINRNILKNLNVKTLIKNIYFSDHDAIQLRITNKYIVSN